VFGDDGTFCVSENADGADHLRRYQVRRLHVEQLVQTTPMGPREQKQQKQQVEVVQFPIHA
jgi:hypothetical protein